MVVAADDTGIASDDAHIHLQCHKDSSWQPFVVVEDAVSTVVAGAVAVTEHAALVALPATFVAVVVVSAAEG